MTYNKKEGDKGWVLEIKCFKKRAGIAVNCLRVSRQDSLLQLLRPEDYKSVTPLTPLTKGFLGVQNNRMVVKEKKKEKVERLVSFASGPPLSKKSVKEWASMSYVARDVVGGRTLKVVGKPLKER